jgi:hypothetical protein
MGVLRWTESGRQPADLERQPLRSDPIQKKRPVRTADSVRPELSCPGQAQTVQAIWMVSGIRTANSVWTE